MTTRKKTTKAAKTARIKKQNAIDLLEQDHELVDSLFKKYERLGEGREAEKKELLERICRELTVHAQIEEEIFYPECRDALTEKDEELLDEATVEHGSVKA